MGQSRIETHWRRVKGFAGHGYGRSVFRRVGLLLTLLVPAYCANLALMYVAAGLLSAEQFGLFYLANTLHNVLFSGSLILNMFFTRHLVLIAEVAGIPAAFGRMSQIERRIVVWGALAGAAVFVAMLAVSSRIGVQSYLLVLFIVIEAYASYVIDLGRVMLQCLHRTVLQGVYTLFWLVLRFVLCIAGIAIFGTVWSALAGAILAAGVIYAGVHLWLRRNRGAVAADAPPLPSLTSVMPAVLGYGLSIVVANLDILLGYLLLSQAELGVYSASSLFPKALLVATTPLLQMLFPMMVGTGQSRSELITLLGKIGLVMLVLTGLGVAVVWRLSPWVCAGTWGMPLCDLPLLSILLLSAVPLVLLRLLVLLGFARGRDWATLWLGPPTLAFVWFALSVTHGAAELARQFALFAMAAFAFFFAVHLLGIRNRAALAD